jgi:SsrA-binding protein
MQKKERQTPTINTRKALHDYFVEERFELGVMLVGSEIKSIRAGRVNLTDAWIDVTDKGEKSELWLVGAHIDEYELANRFNHIPARRRKLLAHKNEIAKMKKALEQKGLTLMALKIYFKKNLAKVEAGICRGKAMHDKRETLKEREAGREVAREMAFHVKRGR